MSHQVFIPFSAVQVGKKNRVVGATVMNQDSSRSHSIFSITIEATERFNSANPGRWLLPGLAWVCTRHKC